MRGNVVLEVYDHMIYQLRIFVTGACYAIFNGLFNLLFSIHISSVGS